MCFFPCHKRPFSSTRSSTLPPRNAWPPTVLSRFAHLTENRIHTDDLFISQLKRFCKQLTIFFRQLGRTLQSLIGIYRYIVVLPGPHPMAFLPKQPTWQTSDRPSKPPGGPGRSVGPRTDQELQLRQASLHVLRPPGHGKKHGACRRTNCTAGPFLGQSPPRALLFLQK